MSRSKAPTVRLSDLAHGQEGIFFALLTEKKRGTTQQGKPYFECRFRDRGRTVAFMAWEDGGHYDEAAEWRPGQFFKLQATYTEHEKYGPQIDVKQVRVVSERDRADGFDEGDFVESTRHDVAAMRTELRTLATRHITDLPLQKLVLTLLDRHGEALARLPATRDRAYPFLGGLLEHTLSVARIALDLAARYGEYYADLKPPLDQGLVLAAALLHDLGRVVEFAEEGAATGLTVPGRLIGPTVLGRDLVRDAAREVEGLDPQLLLLLEHVLLTYAEPPGPKQSLVPEALLLHHADRLDQEMEMYVRCLARDRASGPFTERDPALGHPLFKKMTR